MMHYYMWVCERCLHVQPRLDHAGALDVPCGCAIADSVGSGTLFYDEHRTSGECGAGKEKK